MNSFVNALNDINKYGYTENGAIKYNSLNDSVYDLFAFGAAYRSRTDDDCIFLFKKAFKEDETLALKCLFYIRDCRGGQGERRFFRLCLRWLAREYPERIRYLIPFIPDYGRYDDLFELFGTPLENDVMSLIQYQLAQDLIASEKEGISLIAKWLPSENTSCEKTVLRAKKIRKYLNLNARQYRKILSKLRKKIKVLETLMSSGRWDEIEFDKIPSKAGFIYKNAFARRDIIAQRYKAFIEDKNTSVNAKTLYPYEIVQQTVASLVAGYWTNGEYTQRDVLNKYWESLPDYLNGADCKMLCVIDTSGSMWGLPMNVAISLGLYCAERMTGPFANQYISFASRPQLIKTDGVDFYDKVKRIYNTNLIDNTNLDAVFDLLLKTGLKKNVKKEDMPETIVIISDMEIDSAQSWDTDEIETNMEHIRKKWKQHGFEMPRLVYWNVAARHNTILDSGPNVSYVSGMSPTIFKQILLGKSGKELCLETICSERYEKIK